MESQNAVIINVESNIIAQHCPARFHLDILDFKRDSSTVSLWKSENFRGGGERSPKAAGAAKHKINNNNNFFITMAPCL